MTQVVQSLGQPVVQVTSVLDNTPLPSKRGELFANKKMKEGSARLKEEQ